MIIKRTIFDNFKMHNRDTNEVPELTQRHKKQIKKCYSCEKMATGTSSDHEDGKTCVEVNC